MVLPAICAKTLPGKRVEENLAGMTPRILRGTGDHTINPLCYSWGRKAAQPMLPSCRKLLIRSVLGLCTAFALASALEGQANLEIRTKPGEKAEPRAKANIRVDSTLVLIPV